MIFDEITIIIMRKTRINLFLESNLIKITQFFILLLVLVLILAFDPSLQYFLIFIMPL
jgi:hypothetical protein